MKLSLYHGRLDPNTGATDVDGNPIDDWGFEGPVLAGVKSMGGTYGEVCVHFKTKAHYLVAQRDTGWKDCVHEYGLVFHACGGPGPDVDCVSIFNPRRGRAEYFGDWGLA